MNTDLLVLVAPPDAPVWRVVRAHEAAHGPLAEQGVLAVGPAALGLTGPMGRTRAIQLETTATDHLRELATVRTVRLLGDPAYLPAVALGLALLAERGVDVLAAFGDDTHVLGVLRGWLDTWSTAGPPRIDDAVIDDELDERFARDVGMCANPRCARFEYRVAVDGDVELAVCDTCAQRLVHESGLTWADAAAAGYRREHDERRNRATSE